MKKVSDKFVEELYKVVKNSSSAELIEQSFQLIASNPHLMMLEKAVEHALQYHFFDILEPKVYIIMYREEIVLSTTDINFAIEKFNEYLYSETDDFKDGEYSFHQTKLLIKNINVDF